MTEAMTEEKLFYVTIERRLVTRIRVSIDAVKGENAAEVKAFAEGLASKGVFRTDFEDSIVQNVSDDIIVVDAEEATDGGWPK